MSNKIQRDLSDLRAAGVINEEIAGKIREYYQQRAEHSPNRLMLVFGILGALLVGLGIILIIAHNWDQFSRTAKLFFALLPLLVGQLACAYSLLKRSESRLWRESSGVFLFFAIGASISIVSQVYNIPGSLAGFLFTWMLLSIPIIYIMQSAMTSLLVIGGITWYACALSYFDYPSEIAWYYWPMTATIIPFFGTLMKRPGKNFFHFHAWFVAASLTITLGMFNSSDNYFMFIGYFSLFSLFLMVGQMWFSEEKVLSNAFLVTGSLGSTILALMFTFKGFWADIARTPVVIDEAFVASAVLSMFAIIMLVYSMHKRRARSIHPASYVFLIFIVLFALGKFQPDLVRWITNALVLVIAVLTTWRGAERDNILILNYGLTIMTSLILCRFFDTDLTFIVRGILFMVAGLSFFAANYWVMRRRKLQNS